MPSWLVLILHPKIFQFLADIHRFDYWCGQLSYKFVEITIFKMKIVCSDKTDRSVLSTHADWTKDSGRTKHRRCRSWLSPQWMGHLHDYSFFPHPFLFRSIHLSLPSRMLKFRTSTQFPHMYFDAMAHENENFKVVGRTIFDHWPRFMSKHNSCVCVFFFCNLSLSLSLQRCSLLFRHLELLIICSSAVSNVMCDVCVQICSAL